MFEVILAHSDSIVSKRGQTCFDEGQPSVGIKKNVHFATLRRVTTLVLLVRRKAPRRIIQPSKDIVRYTRVGPGALKVAARIILQL